jgi:hypothetical protein
MKRYYLAILILSALPLLSSCTVETASNPTAVYTPAYYPGSPYWGSTSVYWRNSDNWYRHHHR